MSDMMVTAPIDTSGSSGARVLFIEDDERIADEVSEELRARGFVVRHESTGTGGLAAATTELFDVMIVDRLLPELDGLSVIETVRGHGISTPVLVLSALSAVDDRVTGLRAGGDDYLTKPFAMEELVARIEALLRRPNDTRATMLRVGAVEIDLIERSVMRDGRPVELLPREFRLLEYMMRRPNQVLTRTMLLEDVWNYRFIPQTNLVDVHIGKLRRKIDAPGEAPLIQSIRGVGFLFHVPD